MQYVWHSLYSAFDAISRVTCFAKCYRPSGSRSLATLLITRSATEWWSSLTTHYHSCCDAISVLKKTGRIIFHWYCMHIILATTAPHSMTDVSPFQLMFGRDPKQADFPPTNAFDSSSYSAYLLTKLAKLQDLVANNNNVAAQQQKSHYNKNSATRTFSVGQQIWLSIPTASKLQPRWDGKWTVQKIRSPVNLKITDGKRTKVVHINRVQHRVQPLQYTEPEIPQEAEWCPP